MHIFILGHSNDAHGNLSDVSMSRISLAIGVFERLINKDEPTRFVATGGWGEFNRTSIAHHVWVEREIQRRGFATSLRSGETLQSAHTVEDAVLIKKYCEHHNVRRFKIITSTFHLARSQRIFEAIFNPEPVAILGADDPLSVGPEVYAHERLSIDRLILQGGVIWGSKRYALLF